MLVNGFVVKTEMIDRRAFLQCTAGSLPPLNALKGDQFAKLVFTVSSDLVVAFT